MANPVMLSLALEDRSLGKKNLLLSLFVLTLSFSLKLNFILQVF